MAARSDLASEPVVLDSCLAGARRTPLRLAFGFLSGGPLLWFLAVVCLPLAVLGGAVLFDPRLAGLAVGLSVLFLLGLWWTSYRYAAPQVTIDPTRRTARIEHGATPAWTRSKTVDLDDVERVRIVPLGGFALVRIDYRERTVFEPRDFLVSGSQLTTVEDALAEAGVEVTKLDDSRTPRWRRVEPLVRIVATPTVLLAVPVYAVLAFGTTALRSDTVVVASVVAAWTLQAHVAAALGVRPREYPLAILSDVVGTVIVLAALALAYLQFA
jgi:hypothetical protein